MLAGRKQDQRKKGSAEAGGFRIAGAPGQRMECHELIVSDVGHVVAA